MKNITEVLLRQFITMSSFTRLYTLTGEMSNLIVTVSFHRGGNYVLRKKWIRQSNKKLSITLRETGSYEETEQVIILTSYAGGIRNISKFSEEYIVTDDDSAGDYNIHGWVLCAKSA